MDRVSPPERGLLELKGCLVARPAAGQVDAAIDRRTGTGLPDPDGSCEDGPQLSVTLPGHGRLDGLVGCPLLLQAIQHTADADRHRFALCGWNGIHACSTGLLHLSQDRSCGKHGQGERNGNMRDLGGAAHVECSLYGVAPAGTFLVKTP